MNFLKSLFAKAVLPEPHKEINAAIRANAKSNPGFAKELQAILARHEEEEFLASQAST